MIMPNVYTYLRVNIRMYQRIDIIGRFTAGVPNDQLINNEVWSYLDPQTLQREQWGICTTVRRPFSQSRNTYVQIFAVTPVRENRESSVRE